MKTRLKSIESVKRYALVRLSSVIYMLHKEHTLVKLAGVVGVSAAVLSSIKNNKVKSISLAQVYKIYEGFGIEYTTTVSYRKGVTYYSFETMGYGHFGRTDKPIVEVKEPGRKTKLVTEDPNLMKQIRKTKHGDYDITPPTLKEGERYHSCRLDHKNHVVIHKVVKADGSEHEHVCTQFGNLIKITSLEKIKNTISVLNVM